MNLSCSSSGGNACTPLALNGFAISRMTQVPNDSDRKEADALRRVNEELRKSLASCRSMLADARHRLTANSNEREIPEEDDDEAQSDQSA